MDVLSVMRTMGALGIVLGLLWGALWVVKRYNITLGGSFVAPGAVRRLAVVERAGIDAKRAAILLRRDGREHLVILSPDGPLLVESFDAPPPSADPDRDDAPPAGPACGLPFAAILADRLKSAAQRLPRPAATPISTPTGASDDA